MRVSSHQVKDSGYSSRPGEIHIYTSEEDASVNKGPQLEQVLDRKNLMTALQQVKRNKGGPGIDGMRVDEVMEYLRSHWPEIRLSLFDGTYKPQAVKRVEIPKPGGGVRKLGIPTVIDRIIQQALLQVLQ